MGKKSKKKNSKTPKKKKEQKVIQIDFHQKSKIVDSLVNGSLTDLDDQDIEVLISALDTVEYLQSALEDKATKIGRLRRLFGIKSEQMKNLFPENNENQAKEDSQSSSSSSQGEKSNESKEGDDLTSSKLENEVKKKGMDVSP
jgi:hypothetical protein